MGILLYIILGGLVGYVAARLLGRNEGIIGSVIIGIIGSFIGGFASRLFTGADQSFLTFSTMGLFWSTVGALVLVAILNAFNRSNRHHTV